MSKVTGLKKMEKEDLNAEIEYVRTKIIDLAASRGNPGQIAFLRRVLADLLACPEGV